VTVFGGRMEDLMEADRLIEIDDRWTPDESVKGGRYAEGSRDKARYLSPPDIADPLIKPRHWYLFKEPRSWAPWQPWIEVIAYRVGRLMGVEVPPAYVACRAGDGGDLPTFGALIEWFYEDTQDPFGDKTRDKYESGSGLLKRLKPEFDDVKGRPHAFDLVLQCLRDAGISEEVAVRHWARVLMLDSVIGNRDRHPENWGVVTDRSGKKRLSPAFDNGTALSYEITEAQFGRFDDALYLHQYLTNPKRARHHMVWSLQEEDDLSFFEMAARLAQCYLYTRADMEKALAPITSENLRGVLQGLLGIPVPRANVLTPTRLEFIIVMVERRVRLMKEYLEIP
jgi:hypothetical protein